MSDIVGAVPAPELLNRELPAFCSGVRFAPGEVLREKGQHYTNMYWLTDGQVEVSLGKGPPILRERLSPIGEIGYLRGCASIATATARTAVTALLLDGPAFARIERSRPELTAALLRHLALVAQERSSTNLTYTSGGTVTSGEGVAVHLCRNAAMLEKAQRLRYEVYCEELGRTSPHADPQRRVIADPLDDFANVFIATQAGEIVGTLRFNLAAEGPLGALEELYGMKDSPKHPAATGVCTKFIVSRARRGGPAAMKLVTSVVRFGLRNHVQECYIDCIPALLPYYKALGFRIAAQAFMHPENGPSHPMRLDARGGRRLSKDHGPLDQLQLLLKGQAIKWWQRAQPAAALGRPNRGR